MNRGENVVPNRAISGSMGGMPPDFPGSNFPQREMGNLPRPPHGGGSNMNPNQMNQMSNYANQQRQMGHMNNLQQQQQMQQMQHQRMFNHQRMMMMNAAAMHHNTSHSQLVRPSGPNMSKYLTTVQSYIQKYYISL